MSAQPVDVLAVMANPNGYRERGLWHTGSVANALRLRGQKVTTGRALTALRREARAGRVECLGPASEVFAGHFIGHRVTDHVELIWRLTDDYAAEHGNEACRAALARCGVTA